MKVGAYALLWMAVYFAPQFASDWYESHFNLFQSIIPFTLLLAATVWMNPGWIRRSMMSVLILQVALNATDAILNLSAHTYNNTQGALNSIELMLIFLWGAGEWETYAKRRWHIPNSRGGNPHNPERVRQNG